MAGRPHRGAPSLRGTQPHASGARDVFSIFYQKNKQVRHRNQLGHLRGRGMNVQERGETSDKEQESEETEDEGYFSMR